MKKLILCFSIVSAGLFVSSCVDKHQLGDADEESMPSWLGSSIYGELKNPAGSGVLKGTFNNYVRLVDDLGYDETLNRTGSMTVFPANDDAFEEFFRTTNWKTGAGTPVRSYDDLSLAQKKMLLYSSMLKNALLTDMLSNIEGTDGVIKGAAMKHETAVSVIDTVTYYTGSQAAEVYPNNAEWAPFTGGVAVVKDATVPMMIHFTPEYMTAQGITTLGKESDFAILMGGDYSDGDSYVFRNRIIEPNVTCQNGYIHQVDNVIVPPGNMAQLIGDASDLTIIDRMIDRFAVPVKNQTVTNAYNRWYASEVEAGHDMKGFMQLPDTAFIYEVRYLSSLSQGSTRFINGDSKIDEDNRLRIDPGWNGYYKAEANASGKPELKDMGAMFVPNDATFIKYFTEGEGVTIMEQYGPYPNTAENVIRNIDFIPQNVVAPLVSNMMQEYFSQSVPSKFSTIVDGEAGDFMEITVNDMATDANGNKDVRIANNGVIYVMNRVLTPPSYVAVSSPAKFNTNMSIMNWMISNRTVESPYPLNQDFYAYLLAMKANYALFIPTNEAFGELVSKNFYVDPATLLHNQPRAVHYYVASKDASSGAISLGASWWEYDKDTHTVGDSIELLQFTTANMPIIRSHLVDILNYHTVVMGNGEQLGDNNYYKTKHGGAIKVTGNKSNDMLNGTVVSGGQIQNGLPVSNIINNYPKFKNGYSYIVDNLIQGPTQSVYSVLKNNAQFSKFFEICEGLGNEDLLRWAFGYDSSTNLSEAQQRELDQFKVFTDKVNTPNCLDYNIRFFNMYNYTVYAPDNAAMDIAQDGTHKLPLWEEVMQIYRDDVVNELNDPTSQKLVKGWLIALRDFIRYHFQNTMVFADNKGDTKDYATFLLDKQQINMTLNVAVGGNALTVTDGSGTTLTISATSGNLVNEMTRDFVFDGCADEDMVNPTATNKKLQKKSSAIESSSFAAVHQISTPLYYNSSKDLSKGVER